MHKVVSQLPCRSLCTGLVNQRQKPSLIDANKHLSKLLKRGQVDEARQLFDGMPLRDEFTWNTMITGYANSGKIEEARQLFMDTPRKSSITWSSLVSGYCQIGDEVQSFQLFYEMQFEGYMPSQFTLGSLLRLCSIKGLLSRSEQIHCYAVKASFDGNIFVATGLIDVYAKSLRIAEAEFLFEGIPFSSKNHVTWTAMINGYSQNGDASKAIACFRGMRAKGSEANQYTFPGVLSSCSVLSDLVFGRQVHSCIVRGGFGANVFVQSSLVDMYAKCGDLSIAWNVVESMETDDAISWNTLIVGCVRKGFPEKALSLFRTMRSRDMKPDEFTYPSVLNSLASMKDVENGKGLHSLVVKSGFDGYTLLSNALIDMYAKHGNLSDAFTIFNSSAEKDMISWTSLIGGCSHSCLYEESLALFRRMLRAGIQPDHIVVSSVVSSCAELALLDLGQQLHASSVKSCLDESLSVANSLISLYANCGCLDKANEIFDSMHNRNVISWTALIVGYAQNCEGAKSLQLYEEMISSGVEPDYITFIGVLFACSHAGLVQRGRHYFDSMVRNYNITPGPDHYACMIDLLGRSGKMNEAEELLDEMPIEPDSTVWKSLLASCRIHGDIDLAEKAAKALLEIDPRDPALYVMLSNIYSGAGKWNRAASIRRLMRSRGVGKQPGFSWMEISGTVHWFLSEDRRHTRWREIFAKVDEVLERIKVEGYVPDVSFALHDVGDEAKTSSVAYHSEKLALAFALLCLPKEATVRIYKNIRVCGDCHSAMKFASRVYGRSIVLRDSNRFHHFGDGRCSCGDYW